MWDRALLKKNAKQAFRRNYWTCVAVSAVAMMLTGGFSFGSGGGNSNSSEVSLQTNQNYSFDSLMAIIEKVPDYVWTIIWASLLVGTVIGLCIALFVSNVVQIGCNRYFLENREHKTEFGQLFYGFQGGRYSSNVWVMFLRTLYIWGWSLLFLIPGIVKAYSYMLVPYILAENSNLDRRRVFELSREMMRGYKWKAFVLELSFFGWNLLSVFTYGILNIFYVNPYMYATYAEFYSALKAEAKMRGILQPGELPDRLIVEEQADA